jgi:hypothetical protein
MAHYAILNEDNIVENVITGIDENQLIEGMSTEQWYSNFFGKKVLRTSYNNNIRKNYAGIGFTYNEELDAFIEPQPAEDWYLDTETCRWINPNPILPEDNLVAPVE